MGLGWQTEIVHRVEMRLSICNGIEKMLMPHANRAKPCGRVF